MKTVVFIDGDNFSYKKSDDILSYLAGHGSIDIKIFANQQNIIGFWFKAFDDSSYDLNSIEVIKSRFNKKNSSDIKLIVESMKCLYEDDFDNFVFVSGDSDYKPVIELIKRKGKRTVIISGENISKDLVSVCDDSLVFEREEFSDFDAFYDKFKSIKYIPDSKKEEVVEAIKETMKMDFNGAFIRDYVKLKTGVEMGRNKFENKLRNLGFDFVDGNLVEGIFMEELLKKIRKTR